MEKQELDKMKSYVIEQHIKNAFDEGRLAEMTLEPEAKMIKRDDVAKDLTKAIVKVWGV